MNDVHTSCIFVWVKVNEELKMALNYFQFASIGFSVIVFATWRWIDCCNCTRSRLQVSVKHQSWVKIEGLRFIIGSCDLHQLKSEGGASCSVSAVGKAGELLELSRLTLKSCLCGGTISLVIVFMCSVLQLPLYISRQNKCSLNPARLEGLCMDYFAF